MCPHTYAHAICNPALKCPRSHDEPTDLTCLRIRKPPHTASGDHDMSMPLAQHKEIINARTIASAVEGVVGANVRYLGVVMDGSAAKWVKDNSASPQPAPRA